MMVKISNIKWDTDGVSYKELGLPRSVTMRVRKELLDDPYLEELGDKLSDKYGYCHYGFSAKEIKKKTSKKDV